MVAKLPSLDILISIDDTDDLDSPGTGELAAEIAGMIETRGWGETSFITRHQLFLHPDIPYTSHNSAMCFPAVVEPGCRETLIAAAADFLTRQSAPGSDPGLCVVATTSVSEPKALIGFGQTAKGSVLTKDDAYGLARRLGVHLSEHGGTGQGVIGALAGAGLRLGGNDGRMRGTLTLPPAADHLSVGDLLAFDHVDAVQTRDGDALPDDAMIRLFGDKVKTVMIGGRSILLVTADPLGDNDAWRSCSPRELKSY